MAEPINLLPHQTPITGMNLHAPTGVSKGANEEVRQFIESLARVALKTTSPQETKAIFDSIKPSAEAAGYGAFLANAFGMAAMHDANEDAL